eukprot:scaffold1091_cov164-Ochromonas_danica.AAC.79
MSRRLKGLIVYVHCMIDAVPAVALAVLTLIRLLAMGLTMSNLFGLSRCERLWCKASPATTTIKPSLLFGLDDRHQQRDEHGFGSSDRTTGYSGSMDHGSPCAPF